MKHASLFALLLKLTWTAEVRELAERVFAEMHTYAGYRALKGPDGKPFSTFEEFCLAPYPWGLGYDRETIEGIIAERRDPRVIVRQAPTLREPGRPPKADTENPSIRRVSYGETTTYLAARLKRDRPDIAAQLEAGAYPSVYAAARAAGIVSPTKVVKPSVESFVRAAYQLLSPEQRRELAKKLLDEHAAPVDEQRRRPLPNHHDAEA